jgi:hypothetical protein
MAGTGCGVATLVGGRLAAYTPICEQNAKGARGYAPDAGLLTVAELQRVADALA